MMSVNNIYKQTVPEYSNYDLKQREVFHIEQIRKIVTVA